MTTRRGDDHDGTRVLGSWSQANSVLAQLAAQDAPLGVWETVFGAGRFYRYLHSHTQWLSSPATVTGEVVRRITSEASPIDEVA
jgi:hypothetical protein